MDGKREVLVCQYVNCCENGSEAVLQAFWEHPVAGVEAVGSGCQGQCNMGVTVRVLPDETWYCRVTPEDVPLIVEEHLRRDNQVDRLLHPRFHPSYQS